MSICGIEEAIREMLPEEVIGIDQKWYIIETPLVDVGEGLKLIEEVRSKGGPDISILIDHDLKADEWSLERHGFSKDTVYIDKIYSPGA
uniref:Uncharacterized protein n=1 Tax=viral metagenome TaxID=1070528 RepID=A0A6M3JH80_9ZZZZ